MKNLRLTHPGSVKILPMTPAGAAAPIDQRFLKFAKWGRSAHSSIEEIERRYAERIPNAKTRAALAEDTRKAHRYKSADQLLKALKA